MKISLTIQTLLKWKNFVWVLILILSILLISTGCTDGFSTRYERIDNTLVRPIAITFNPAEAAPGDTVKITASFAGSPVTAVDWKISFDYFMNIFGVDTALHVLNLTESPQYVPGSFDSVTDLSGTFQTSVSVVIPLTLIRDNFNQAQSFAKDFSTFIAQLPDYLKSTDLNALFTTVEFIVHLYTKNLDSLITLDSLNIEMFGLSEQDIITLFSLFSITDTIGISSLNTTSGLKQFFSLIHVQLKNQQFQQQITQLTQALSTMIKLQVMANTQYRMDSYMTIRYTSKMTYNPTAQSYTNRNPEIDWIGIYRVPGENTKQFDPSMSTNYDTIYYLYHKNDSTCLFPDTVLIDIGFSYFLGAGMNPLVRDTGHSTSTDNKELEQFYYDWMYRNNVPVTDVNVDSLIVINNVFQDSTVLFLPPVDSRMNDFSIWLTVYDYFLGEKFRPRGFASQAARGWFKFTDAYIAKHN